MTNAIWKWAKEKQTICLRQGREWFKGNRPLPKDSNPLSQIQAITHRRGIHAANIIGQRSCTLVTKPSLIIWHLFCFKEVLVLQPQQGESTAISHWKHIQLSCNSKSKSGMCSYWLCHELCLAGGLQVVLANWAQSAWCTLPDQATCPWKLGQCKYLCGWFHWGSAIPVRPPSPPGRHLLYLSHRKNLSRQEYKENWK